LPHIYHILPRFSLSPQHSLKNIPFHHIEIDPDIRQISIEHPTTNIPPIQIGEHLWFSIIWIQQRIGSHTAHTAITSSLKNWEVGTGSVICTGFAGRGGTRNSVVKLVGIRDPAIKEEVTTSAVVVGRLRNILQVNNC
jgi:hypothetical protein